MAPILLIFYAIAVAIILALAYAAFVVLRRYGRIVAGAASLMVAASAVLVWPIPIHGGFMLLSEAMFDEWSRERARGDERREAQENALFIERYAQRFAGELPIIGGPPTAPGWAEVQFAPGGRAWLDGANGQVWSEWLPLETNNSLPGLEAAKQACSEYRPRGYWALPTEAEHALAWKSGAANALPKSNAGSVSYVVDAELGLELPTYRVTSASNAGTGPLRRFAVQCVARAPGGPIRGYIKRDVALEDWNRYQLSKSGGS